MQTDPPPPRRNWHLKRWFTLLVIALFAWCGWHMVPYRLALHKAQALQWRVFYTDQYDAIRFDLKNAFRKTTWTPGAHEVFIPSGESFEEHVAIVHRLNPRYLQIDRASSLHDLSGLTSLNRMQQLFISDCTRLTDIDALHKLSTLKELTLYGNTALKNLDALKNHPSLERIELDECTGLTNLDALKHLPALKSVYVTKCKGLTNVDALKSLPALENIVLSGCTGLTRESVEALRAALPKMNIEWP